MELRQRYIKLKLLQQSALIQKFALPRGEAWRVHYFKIRQHMQLKAAPIELAQPPPYKHCNSQLLYTALKKCSLSVCCGTVRKTVRREVQSICTKR
jgi:hypothetical protein